MSAKWMEHKFTFGLSLVCETYQYQYFNVSVGGCARQQAWQTGRAIVPSSSIMPLWRAFGCAPFFLDRRRRSYILILGVYITQIRIYKISSPKHWDLSWPLSSRLDERCRMPRPTLTVFLPKGIRLNHQPRALDFTFYIDISLIY